MLSRIVDEDDRGLEDVPFLWFDTVLWGLIPFATFRDYLEKRGMLRFFSRSLMSVEDGASMVSVHIANWAFLEVCFII